jgi:hypothetical protein
MLAGQSYMWRANGWRMILTVSPDCSELAIQMNSPMKINRKIIGQLMTVFMLACGVWSCKEQSPAEYYTSQRIPIEVQSGKAVTVKITLSGNGPNDVGIRCSPEVWQALTSGPKTITARVTSSSESGTVLDGVQPGGTADGFLYLIPDVKFLFEISGGHNATAVVEITFPNGPTVATPAEIVVGKTPADTGL